MHSWLDLFSLKYFNFLHVLVLVGIFSAVFGWFDGRRAKYRENDYNRELTARLDAAKQDADHRQSELDERQRLANDRQLYLSKVRSELEASIVGGRRWLAKFIADADSAYDDAISTNLRLKSRPAYKAAEEVAEARAERREYRERLKFLEYQLASYKEYFPFLEEYEDVILDEAVSFNSGGGNLAALDDADPVLRYVQKGDYDKLSNAQRNQLALDRYLGGNLGPSAIGRMYERYLGYLWEKDGWTVNYHGIVKGFEDLGRDLICSQGSEVKIIQAKCWASHKTIHEKHIFQLFGTTQLFLMDQTNKGNRIRVSSVFVTSTSLSPVALEAAKWLNVEVFECYPLVKSFPMIKCNINQRTKEKIYHLPFDQQYDKTKISPSLGEFYATTTAEAESRGFRRAFRYHGNQLAAR